MVDSLVFRNFQKNLCRITIHVLQVNLEKNSEVPFLVLSLSYYRKKIKERNFTMNKITQDMRFRLSLIKYADKYGVTVVVKLFCNTCG